MVFYGSPDQIIPLATVLSTVSGFVLIFWGKILRAVHKLTNWFSARAAEGEKPKS